MVVLLLPGGHLSTAEELPDSLRALTSEPSLALDLHDFDEAVDRLAGVLLKTRMKRDCLTGDPGNPTAGSTEELPFTRGSDLSTG